MKITNQTKGLITITISAFCFGTLGTLGVLLFKGGANPITILTGRFLIATLMLFFTLLIRDTKLFKVEKKDIKWFLLSGAILFAQLITFWYGFRIVKSVAIQYSLFFTYPIFAAIISGIFLKRKISKIVPVCIAIGSIGILLVLGIIPNGVSVVPLAGVGLGLLTALIWALYYFSNQFLVQKYNSFTIIFYNFLFTFVACLFMQPALLTISEISLSVFWYLLALGLIATYGSYLFLQYALRFSGTVVSSIQNMILPVLGSLLAFIVLGQILTTLQALGAFLIVFNIYLLNKWKTN